MMVVTNIKYGEEGEEKGSRSCNKAVFLQTSKSYIICLHLLYCLLKFFTSSSKLHRVGAVLCLGQCQQLEWHVKMVDHIENMDNLKDNSLMIKDHRFLRAACGRSWTLPCDKPIASSAVSSSSLSTCLLKVFWMLTIIFLTQMNVSLHLSSMCTNSQDVTCFNSHL